MVGLKGRASLLCGRGTDARAIAQRAAQGALPVAPVASVLPYSAATGLVETPDKSLDRDTDRRDSDMHVDALRHGVAKEWLLVA